MTRDLKKLHPVVEKLTLQFIKRVKEQHGITLLVTGTLRTIQEQDDLYKQGRVILGPIVTWVKGGNSWHNYGLAIDVVPVIGGKAVWGDSIIWQAIGLIGKDLGFIWGGDFPEGKTDSCHFEYHPKLSLKEVKRRLSENLDVLTGEKS
jgi:hypothetical protein